MTRLERRRSSSGGGGDDGGERVERRRRDESWPLSLTVPSSDDARTHTNAHTHTHTHQQRSSVGRRSCRICAALARLAAATASRTAHPRCHMWICGCKRRRKVREGEREREQATGFADWLRSLFFSLSLGSRLTAWLFSFGVCSRVLLTLDDHSSSNGNTARKLVPPLSWLPSLLLLLLRTSLAPVTLCVRVCVCA